MITAKQILRRFNSRKAALASALGIAAMSLTSCDSAIYDYEGDCEPLYRVNFCYDYNMKFADAFPHEVNSVTLRLIDESGNVVWSRTESGEAVSRPGYYMDVDCQPGTYSLHVWAEGHEGESFALAPVDAGQLDALTANLPRKHAADGSAVSNKQLRDLYFGYVADVAFPETEGTHLYTVPLIKDTNYLRVVLQQTSAATLNPDDLEITVTDENGSFDCKNNLLDDEIINYRPWAVTPLKADIEGKGECSGVLAEFSLSRLMVGHRADARVTVRTQGRTIFSVKLIDLLLLVKGNYNHKLGEQEYLDRQDTWDLVFFLDEGYQWLASYIYINSWRVVLQSEDLQ